MKSSYALKWLAAIVIVGVMGFIYVSTAGGARAKSAAPAVAQASQPGQVQRRNLIQRVTITGQIVPRKRLDVRPQYKGYLTKLYVKIGDRVKTGDPLVTFSPSLASGETNFPVRAAFNGVVTQVLKQEGEYVSDQNEQNLAVRVEDTTQLFVLASVPELDIAKIKIGQEALIRVAAVVGESFKGIITEINLSARDKERWSSSSTEFQIRIEVKSRDPRLLPGLSAVMDVITDKRENALALPHEFIQEDSEGYFVTINKGEKRRIKAGLQTDEAIEIIEGVKEGEVTRAIDFLSLPALED